MRARLRIIDCLPPYRRDFEGGELPRPLRWSGISTGLFVVLVIVFIVYILLALLHR